MHWKDFTKRYKAPEVGDKIMFELGKDKQGRPCALKAVHVNEGGRLTSESIFFLLLLVGAPICAVVRLSRSIAPEFLATYAVALSVLTYLAYAWDKSRARKKGRREPEIQLHALELLGGWPGAFVAQRRLRHKCSKVSYQLVFWSIVIVYELVSIDFLRGWALARQLKQLVS